MKKCKGEAIYRTQIISFSQHIATKLSGRDKYSKWSSRYAAFKNKASFYEFGYSSRIIFSSIQILLFYYGSSKNPQPYASAQRSESCSLLSSLEGVPSSCEWRVNNSRSWKLGSLSAANECKNILVAHFQMSVTCHFPTDISFFHLSLELPWSSPKSHTWSSPKFHT